MHIKPLAERSFFDKARFFQRSAGSCVVYMYIGFYTRKTHEHCTKMTYGFQNFRIDPPIPMGFLDKIADFRAGVVIDKMK